MLKNIQITQFRGGASHFVLFYALIRYAYDVMVQFSIIFIFNLSHFCLSVFVRRYSLHRFGFCCFLFLNKLFRESEQVWEGYISERVLFAVAGNIVVSDVVACVLELVIRFYLFIFKIIYIYVSDAIYLLYIYLGYIKFFIALHTYVHLFIYLFYLLINLNKNMKVIMQRTVAIDKPVDTSLGVHLTLIYGLPTPRFTAIPVPTKLQMTRARR
ncbi:unnamed protein product [Musa hybrid cultivar]